jgi:hypothetical protein
MKRFFQIGISIIGIIAIGALSGLLINTNLELGRMRNSLSYASTSAAETQIYFSGAVSTLSAENLKLDQSFSEMQKTKIAIGNENIQLLQRIVVLNTKINCPWPIKNPDFTSNSTISKDLLEWVGDRDGSNLKAQWEILYANSKAAIHRITGKYYWVFIVMFNDPARDVHNSIFDVGDGCYMHLES